MDVLNMDKTIKAGSEAATHKTKNLIWQFQWPVIQDLWELEEPWYALSAVSQQI